MMKAATKPSVNTHSYGHFRDLQLSPGSFYDLIEQLITAYQYPEITTKRMKLNEGGIFSPGKEYLCIKRGKYVYNVCATPFGKSFMISWWIKEEGTYKKNFLSKVLFIRRHLIKQAKMKTHYELDMEMLFMQSIDALIKEAVNTIKTQNEFVAAETIVEMSPN